MMLVLDSSGSMKERAGGDGTKIAAAKSALRTVIKGLPDQARVGLRVFGAEVFSRDDEGACTDSQAVVKPGTDNRQDLLDAIRQYKPYGETPIPYALRQAAKDLGGEGNRSIVLVSDGESTCSPNPCKVAREVANDGINVRIDVVGLSVSGKARRQLQCIAENGNGAYYDADSAANIETRLDRAATRAIRPFTLTGSPIEGGAVDSPTEVSVGDLTDTIGPEDSDTASRSYWFERNTKDSTLRVSAITQGQQGTGEGLDVEIVDEAGESCAKSRTIRQIDTRRVVGVLANASVEEECGKPGRYRITVSRRLADEKTVPFGLRVAEEPPLAGDRSSAADAEADVTAPEVQGEAKDVEGGASFANAAEIGAGRWSSNLVPGEALMYRLPLEFGQAARVRVHFPKGSAAMQEEAGRHGTLSHMVVYNPMQGQLSKPRDAELSGTAGGDEALNLLTAIPAVSPDLVEADGFNGVEDYSMAGDYYLAVSMRQDDHSVEIPFTIEVEVVGDPGQGPTYADGATWSVAEVVGANDQAGNGGDESTASGGDGTAAKETDDGPFAEKLAVGVIGGLLAIAVVVGALLVWRRRRASWAFACLPCPVL